MNPALIVIDMQNWFFRTRKKRAKLPELIKSITQLIDSFETHNLPIYHILTIHKKDKSTWTKSMKRENAAVLIEGTKEAEELKEIKRFKTDIIIHKTRMSAFSQLKLQKSLKKNNIDTLVITGVYTHSCVGLTAIDASEKDYDVIVAKDATFSYRVVEARVMLNFIKRLGERVLDKKTIFHIIAKSQ